MYKLPCSISIQSSFGGTIIFSHVDRPIAIEEMTFEKIKSYSHWFNRETVGNFLEFLSLSQGAIHGARQRTPRGQSVRWREGPARSTVSYNGAVREEINAQQKWIERWLNKLLMDNQWIEQLLMMCMAKNGYNQWIEQLLMDGQPIVVLMVSSSSWEG